MAIGEVDRQILAAATLPGGVPDKSAHELIAGRDMGDDMASGPSLAQSSLGPAACGYRIDRLQIPTPGLGEPAGLCFHLGYLSAAESSGVQARLIALGPPLCVLRSTSQVRLFVGDKEPWDGPSA